MSGEKDLDDQLDDDLTLDEGEFGDADYDEAGGEDFGDEDWDSYEEDYGEGEDGDEAAADDEAAPAKGKKKAAGKKGSSLSNKIIMGVGIAAAVGVGLMMMGGGGSAPPPAAPVQQQAQTTADGQPVAAPQQQQYKLNSASLQGSGPQTQRAVVYGLGRNDETSATQSIEGGGLLNNEAELNKIQEYRANIEDELAGGSARNDDSEDSDAPAVVANEPPMPMPMPMTAPVQSEGGGDDAGAGGVLTPMPSDNLTDTAQAAGTTENAAQSPADPFADDTATPAVAPTGRDKALVAENSVGLPRASDLRMAGDDVAAPNAEPQNNGLTDTAPDTMPDTAAVTPTASMTDEAVTADAMITGGADTAALNEKLDDISRRLSAMENEIATLQSQSGQSPSGSDPAMAKKLSSLEKTVSQLETALENGARNPAPRVTTGSGTVKAASRKTVTAPKTTTTKASTTTKAGVKWTLKSAQPGHAMVSQGTSDDVRSVAVGDSLTGIGRITGIYQGPGGWVVEGTTGRINQ